MTNLNWKKSVGKVFRIYPRIGTDKNTIWVHRKREESSLLDLILTDGKSICLDGPSGVGKTSLALTTLEMSKCPFVEIQITKNTDCDKGGRP